MREADFDAQGHRGARGLMPENTLPAFAQALAIGVTTLELDCAVTADDIAVVSHDAALNPDITRLDGEWLAQPGPAIRSLPCAALSRYDVGAIRPDSAYARRFPQQQPHDGLRIPRLAEVFALTVRAAAKHVRFNIETKIDPTRPHLSVGPEAFVRAIMREALAANLRDRVMIQSFDWRALALVQREYPEVPTAYLTSQAPDYDTVQPFWNNDLRLGDHDSVPAMVHAAGGAIWSPRVQDLDDAAIDAAHALGLRVVPWTVNDPADMARLMDRGVDGLISDYPDRLREAMAARGMPLPPRAPIRLVDGG
jgi:glycerophosphoryl diester phosphodiesterase